MNRSWFYLSILLAASLTPISANEASQVLDSELKSWSRLKREAGYFTESGRWRGGLYQVASHTETGQYRCLNRAQSHCTSWSVSEDSSGRHKTGTCTCKETTSPFCQDWTCNTSHQYDCSTQQKSKTCTAKETVNCYCILSAGNERYCLKWRCRDDSNTKSGGYHENEDYMCVAGDASGEYCFRWHGNTSSKYWLKSSACQCFERGQSFCHYWQCRERKIGRCTRSGLGWCRLEISIGVGGGMGLLTFAISVGFPLAVARGHQDLMTPLVVLVFFIAFCLPWSLGVLIWGGVFGFPWVLPMWSVGYIAISYGAKQVNKERQRRRNARATQGLQNRQRFQPITPGIRRPLTASGIGNAAYSSFV